MIHVSQLRSLSVHDIKLVMQSEESLGLQGLDLKVPAGTSCAIVGTSGSGKSTLMRLLFRMFDSTQGNITINGTNIKEASLAALPAQLA